MLETLKESSEDNIEVKEESTPIIKKHEELYKLANVRREKLKIRKEEMEKHYQEKEINGCTFSPIFTKYVQTPADIKLTEKLKNFNEKKNENVNKNKTIDYSGVFQTDKMTKNNKLSHTIIDRNLIYKGIVVPSDKIVKSSSSYNKFVEKIKNTRKEKELRKEEILNTPGYGRIWKSTMTIGKAPNFIICGENNLRDNTIIVNHDIRSLDKTYVPEKFSTLKSNDFSTFKDPEIDETLIKNEENLAEIIEKFKNSSIKIDQKMLYSEAQKLLHNELRSFKL